MKIYVYFEWHVQCLLVKNHILTCFVCEKIQQRIFHMIHLLFFNFLAKAENLWKLIVFETSTNLFKYKGNISAIFS